MLINELFRIHPILKYHWIKRKRIFMKKFQHHHTFKKKKRRRQQHFLRSKTILTLCPYKCLLFLYSSIACSVPQGQFPFACAVHAEKKTDAKQVSQHATKTEQQTNPQPPSRKRKMKTTLLLLSLVAIALISQTQAFGK